MKNVQRSDGSWLGHWAICFCYASWFGVWGLLAAGEPTDSKVIQKACEFLVKKQMKDGGWVYHMNFLCLTTLNRVRVLCHVSNKNMYTIIDHRLLIPVGLCLH